MTVETAQHQMGMRRFTIQLVIAAIVFTALTFTAIYARSRALLYESLRDQAANHFDLIVTARAWNAHQNGVWVVMRDGVEPNPYLDDLGVDAVIETTEGQQLTLRNPAIMADEISQLLKTRRGITYHLVALEPVNPYNTPDEWERDVLLGFDDSDEPQWTIDHQEQMFRYMRPLKVEGACVPCHQAQSYEIGQVAGATTVEIPMASLNERLRGNVVTLVILGTLSAMAATGSILLMTRRLNAQVSDARNRLVGVARTDELTGLLNRRGTLARLETEVARSARTGTPLALAMLDLDHFKNVNDTFGHSVGDEMLRHFARLVDDESRSYDIVGRLGGEEFLLIAPETDLEEAAIVAERIRTRVAAEPLRMNGEPIPMTVSIGVTELTDGEDIDALLLRADAAMYAAKDAGRDQVVAG